MLKIFFFALLCAACGDNGSARRDAKKPEPKTRLSISGNTPLLYHRADESCGKEQSIASLNNVSVWLYSKNGTTVSKQTVNIAGTNGAGLENELISGVYYLGQLGFDTAKKAEPKRLNICATEYPRESIENVALAVVYALTESYRKLQKTWPVASTFKKKLRVYVHPTFFQEKREGKSVQKHAVTDNLYWTSTSTEQAILVLPHSNEHSDKFDAKVWEVTTSVAHELGHHLFNQALSKSNFIEQSRNIQEPLKGSTHLENKMMNALLLSGLQEGFCDCHGRYSMPEHHFFGATNRDLRSPYLLVPPWDGLNLMYKEFSDELFHAVRFGSEGKDLQVFLADQHTFGGIWAYVIDQRFEQAFAGLAGQALIDRKLSALHRFALRLSLLSTRLDPGTTNFKHFFAELISCLELASSNS